MRTRPKKTYVVVNRHKIAANRKNGTMDNPIRVSVGKRGKPRYAKALVLVLHGGGIAKLIYDPDHPMPCGATVWLEVDGEFEWAAPGQEP